MKLHILDFSDAVPGHMRDGIENYLLHGYTPGGFLESVLCNDLIRASMKADERNKEMLSYMVRWMVHNLPEQAWGDRDRYRDWLLDKDNRRSNYAKVVEEHFTLKVLQTEQPKSVRLSPGISVVETDYSQVIYKPLGR